MPSQENPSASDLKLQALSLFRSARHAAGRQLLLNALLHSPVVAASAIADLAEANASVAEMRDLLAAAVKIAPEQPRLWQGLGRVAAIKGELERAIPHFSEARRLAPDDAEHALALGVALKHAKRTLDALPHLRSAHDRQPSATTARVLADAELDANHPELAHPLYVGLLAASPRDTTLRLRLAEVCSQLTDIPQALAILREGVALTPDSPDLHMAMAQALEDEGNSKEAEHSYRTVLTMVPEWPIALAGLVDVLGTEADPHLLDRARSLLSSPSTSMPDKALLGYALGKALDRQGHFAEAMRAWNTANEARESVAGTFSPESLARHLDALESAYGDGAHATTTTSPSPDLVFVVGMPRSGTTLTERILSAHPHVHGCGELPDLPRITYELGPDWPRRIADLAPEELEALKAGYLRSAQRNAPGDARVLIDKAPLNFFQLGLARTLFPTAKVIWCRRDRRDVALSIYSENFSPASSFSTSLAGISAYQDAEDRLLAMWQRVLDIPILVQEYEHLVISPEEGSRRLVDFIGLEWHADVLRPHEIAGTVQTPSRWQVRQPIHTRSIGRWRNYASLL